MDKSASGGRSRVVLKDSYIGYILYGHIIWYVFYGIEYMVYSMW